MSDCCYEQLQKILENGNERFLPISRKTNVVSTATYSPTATIVDTYICGLDSSDELCDGRGMVPELPFSTFNGLNEYIRNNIVANSVNVHVVGNIIQAQKLYTDITDIPWNIIGNGHSVTAPLLSFGNICKIDNCDFTMTSTDDTRALLRSENGGSLLLTNVTATSTVYTAGCFGLANLFVTNCSFSSTGSNGTVLYADTASNIYIGSGITISGKGLAALMLSTGSCLAYNAQDATLIKGSFTGKKYHLTRGSFLITRGNQSSLPGTLAGTVGEGCQIL